MTHHAIIKAALAIALTAAGAAPAAISEIARAALMVALRIMLRLQAFVRGLYPIPALPGSP